MTCRPAVSKDLEGVFHLQSKYHVKTVADDDRDDGFVTTLFTKVQLQALIDQEKGLFVLEDGEKIVGYVMSGSWNYWKAWPMFQHMIDDLDDLQYLGHSLNVENSYQYGPICIDKDYRGSGALELLFEFARKAMASRFPILLTFVNTANPRSVAAHERKLGLDRVQEFEYNGNRYIEFGCDTSKPLHCRI